MVFDFNYAGARSLREGGFRPKAGIHAVDGVHFFQIVIGYGNRRRGGLGGTDTLGVEMHFRLELILPPGSGVADAEEPMQYVSEYAPPGYDEDTGEPEWIGEGRGIHDYYLVGGRWTGAHAQAHYSKEDLDRFREILREREVKVSGVQFGKPTLASHSPEEIDKWWREEFPNGLLSRCPLFDYADFGDVDVIRVADLHPDDVASMVYVCGPQNQYRRRELYQRTTWNGLTWQKTDWDGNIAAAIKRHNDGLDRASQEYRDHHLVTGEWVAITIDIHS